MILIKSFDELQALQRLKIFYFDLDSIIIASIFSSKELKDPFRFIGYGKREARYAILRPGMVKLIKAVKENGFKVGIATDARRERALLAINQFRLAVVDFLVVRETLKEVEAVTGIERRRKPLTALSGMYLLDDCLWALLDKGKATRVRGELNEKRRALDYKYVKSRFKRRRKRV